MLELSEREKIQLVHDVIEKVAPEKLLEEFNLDTSIINDLALDSIEIMDVLIELQEHVSKKRHTTKIDTNVDSLLSYLFAKSDDLSVKSL